jgi:hypothetical protein
VAVKIVNNNASSADHEREVEEHISTVDPSHRGRSLIRTLLDSFEVKRPRRFLFMSCVSAYEGVIVDVSATL